MPRWLLMIMLTVLGGITASCLEVPAARPSLLDLAAPQGDIVLEVTGAVSNRNSDNGAQFDMEMLRALPSAIINTHTSVMDGVQRFEGFRLRDLLRGLGASGATIRASSLNDYSVDIPLADLEKFDVIVAHSMNGAPLSLRDKGPLWIVYPRDQHPELQDIRYDYRWVWQLKTLEVE